MQYKLFLLDAARWNDERFFVSKLLVPRLSRHGNGLEQSQDQIKRTMVKVDKLLYSAQKCSKRDFANI